LASLIACNKHVGQYFPGTGSKNTLAIIQCTTYVGAWWRNAGEKGSCDKTAFILAACRKQVDVVTVAVNVIQQPMQKTRKFRDAILGCNHSGDYAENHSFGTML